MRGHEWTCDECGKAIAPDDGILVLFNASEEHGTVGSYPQVPSADLDAAFERELLEERREKGERHPTGIVNLAEVGPALAAAHQANPRNVGMIACHHGCFPWDDRKVSPYVIQLRDLQNGEHVVDWLLHLSEKTWIGKRDLLNFVRKYAGRPPDVP
jgi:hypothetical protein